MNTDLLKNEKAVRGLFIGVSGIDTVFCLDGPLPAENEKIKTESFYMAPGGPAAKAAEIFSSLGGNASLITCIGRSPLGDHLRRELEKSGVSVTDIAGENYTIPNVSAVCLRQESGSRTLVSGQLPLHGISFDGAVTEDFDFCLYDCNLPALTPEIIGALRARRIPLVLDCGSWKPNIEDALEYADTAISSSGFRSPEGLDIFDLQKKYGIRLAARTNDGDPIEYCEKGVRGTVPVEKIKGGNTLGAGDIFHGAFCGYYFGGNKTFPDSLRAAAVHTAKIIRSR